MLSWSPARNVGNEGWGHFVRGAGTSMCRTWRSWSRRCGQGSSMERETRPYLRRVKGGAQMKEPRNKPGRAIWLLLLMVLGAAISSPQPSLQGRAGKENESVGRVGGAP